MRGKYSLGQKIFFWSKNFFGQKHFFGRKKFWVKKFFGQKKFWVKKFLGFKNFVWLNKNLGLIIFRVNIFVGKNLFLTQNKFFLVKYNFNVEIFGLKQFFDQKKKFRVKKI